MARQRRAVGEAGGYARDRLAERGPQVGADAVGATLLAAADPAAGEKIFAKCTACHDTARFTGEGFIDPWAGKPLKDVWDIASGTMPEDNPGSLKPQEYGDVIAYFLALNAFPTGDAELQGEASAMANVLIEKKK